MRRQGGAEGQRDGSRWSWACRGMVTVGLTAGGCLAIGLGSGTAGAAESDEPPTAGASVERLVDEGTGQGPGSEPDDAGPGEPAPDEPSQGGPAQEQSAADTSVGGAPSTEPPAGEGAATEEPGSVGEATDPVEDPTGPAVEQGPDAAETVVAAEPEHEVLEPVAEDASEPVDSGSEPVEPDSPSVVVPLVPVVVSPVGGATAVLPVVATAPGAAVPDAVLPADHAVPAGPVAEPAVHVAPIVRVDPPVTASRATAGASAGVPVVRRGAQTVRAPTSTGTVVRPIVGAVVPAPPPRPPAMAPAPLVPTVAPAEPALPPMPVVTPAAAPLVGSTGPANAPAGLTSCSGSAPSAAALTVPPWLPVPTLVGLVSPSRVDSVRDGAVAEPPVPPA